MRDINRILCPVDLSDVSRDAINHAVLLASWYKAKITALHVCNPLVVPETDFTVFGFGPRPALTDEEVNQAREQVLSCFRSAGPDVNVEVLLDSGQAAHQILERAKSLPADVVVIGTHGAGGFERLVLGSVTEKVLRRAACPVLTVPPRAHTTAKLPFKRILCPLDFSESSLAALEFAFSLAQEGDAELTILHVVEWPTEDKSLAASSLIAPEYRRDQERAAKAKLQEVIPESARDWCRPTMRLARGKAYREILGIATEDNADVIVMGVHGHNALDLMLFGSTTNQVVRAATCPVLTVPR
jgi:nucleotide-binding universal stress UspA family protein